MAEQRRERAGSVHDPGLSLGYTAVRLGHTVAVRFQAALAGHGLTLGQYTVLAHLVSRPELAVGELARLLAVTPQSVGVMLDALQADGLLIREPGVRGRQRLSTVTEAGRSRLATAAVDVQQVDRLLERELTSGPADELREIMHTLLRATLAYPGRPAGR